MIPRLRIIATCLVTALIYGEVTLFAATTYYFDNAGSDSNPCSLASKCQTGTKAASLTLAAGDALCFTGGQTFTFGGAPLVITTSGAVGNYVTIGTCRLTAINAGSILSRIAQANPATFTTFGTGNAITVTNAEYVSIDNLVIMGPGVNTSTGATTSTGAGLQFSSTQTTNKLRGNRATALTVTGTKDGIFGTVDVNAHVGYDDLEIWGFDVHACQRLGVGVFNLEAGFSGNAAQNTNIYVGGSKATPSQVYNLPGLPGGTGVGNVGEGVTFRDVTTGTQEYTVVHDINLVGDQGPLGGTAGFTAQGAVIGITIQYDEAYHVFAPLGLDGFCVDAEEGATNTLVQYNYCHDNDGCAYGSGTSGPSTTGNLLRYNVFARDLVNSTNNFAEIWTGGPVQVTLYGNTIYSSHGDGIGVLSGTPSISAANNILIVAAGHKAVQGNSSTATTIGIEGNLYFSIGGGTITVQPGATAYTTLAALRAAGYESNGGMNGVFGDPVLLAPTSCTGGVLPANPVSTVTCFDIPVSSVAHLAGVNLRTFGFVPSTDFHLHGVNLTDIGAVNPAPTFGLIGDTSTLIDQLANLVPVSLPAGAVLMVPANTQIPVPLNTVSVIIAVCVGSP